MRAPVCLNGHREPTLQVGGGGLVFLDRGNMGLTSKQRLKKSFSNLLGTRFVYNQLRPGKLSLSDFSQSKSSLCHVTENSNRLQCFEYSMTSNGYTTAPTSL